MWVRKKIQGPIGQLDEGVTHKEWQRVGRAEQPKVSTRSASTRLKEKPGR